MAKRTKIDEVFRKIMVEREAIGAVLAEFGKKDNPIAAMQEKAALLDSFVEKLFELTEQETAPKPTRTRRRKVAEPTL